MVLTYNFYKWSIYLSGCFLIFISIYLLYLFFIKYKDTKYIYLAATINSIGFLFLYLESKQGDNKILQYSLIICIILFFILFTVLTLRGQDDIFHSVEKIRYDPSTNLETHDTVIRFISDWDPWIDSNYGTYLGYGYKTDPNTVSYFSDFLNISPNDSQTGFSFFLAQENSLFLPTQILTIDRNAVTLIPDDSSVQFGNKPESPKISTRSSNKGYIPLPFHGLFFVHTFCPELQHDMAFVVHLPGMKTLVHSPRNHIQVSENNLIVHVNHKKHPIDMSMWCFSS
jgi:hypothetical protein